MPWVEKDLSVLKERLYHEPQITSQKQLTLRHIFVNYLNFFFNLRERERAYMSWGREAEGEIES